MTANYLAVASRVSSLAPVLLLFFVSSSAGQSQWSSSSVTNNPVITRSGQQFAPVIASDGERGAVIVWTDSRGGNLDIYSMRVTEAGHILGSQGGNPVAVAVNNQEAPSLASAADGRIFVAWQDNRSLSTFKEIWIQRLSTSGEPILPEAVAAHSGNNSPPLILTRPSGAVTASYSTSLFDDVISVQFLNDSGETLFDPQRIVSSEASGRQPNQPPAVVGGLDGGIIATWVDTRQDTVILAKGLLSGGNPWSAGEIVLSESVTPQTYPAAVSDGNEGILVIWFEPEGPEGTDVVRATRLDANGAFVWIPSVREVASSGGKKQNLTLVEDGDNGAYAVWENVVTQDSKILAQRIFGDGSAWSQNVAVAQAVGVQKNAALINDGRGNALVAWEDSRSGNQDIFAQLISAAGNRLWDSDGVPVSTPLRDQSNPKLVSDGLGGAIIVWEDARSGTDSDIFVQRVSKPGLLGEFRTVAVNAPRESANWEVSSSQTIRWTASPEIESVKIELSRDGGLSYQTLFSSLPNLGSESGTVTYGPVSGPASTSCRVRVSAEQASFLFDESNIFSIASPRGPELQLQQVVESRVGDSLLISTSASDVSGVEAVSLNFRLGGAATFTSVVMEHVGENEFRGLVPASFATERGIEYFISSEDSIGQQSRTDTFFVTLTFDAGVQTREVFAGSVQSAYRMVSAPNLLDETLADTIFASSGFGAYDTTSWRLFEFRNDTYVERDSSNARSFSFEFGKAYWLISATARSIDFGAGQSRSVASPSVLTLTPGWNQVGQLFAFRVSWEAILAASGNPMVQGPFLFDGAFQLAATLDPYEGYFVFNLDSQNVSLTIPPIEFAPSQVALSKNVGAGEEWQLAISARCEAARDDFNILGIHGNAEQQWDRLDLPEPPPIGEYVTVSFPREDWQYPNDYTTDYRRDLGSGQTWSFAVSSNITHSEVLLTFAHIANMPPGLEILLVDESLNVTRDLRLDPTYALSSGSKGLTKTLKLVVGSKEFVSSEIGDQMFVPTDFSLSQNFPNPFNPATTIRYGLPRDSAVTLKVYDILGREIVTLIDAERTKAGFHVKTWNGRDRHDRTVASGLYVYRLVAGSFTQTRKMLLVK